VVQSNARKVVHMGFQVNRPSTGSEVVKLGRNVFFMWCNWNNILQCLLLLIS